MKKNILDFLKIYLLFILIFLLQKPLFMLYHLSLYKEVDPGEWFNVIFHGIQLDFSMAGYLTLIPGLLLVARGFAGGVWLKKILCIYYYVVMAIVSIIFVSDLELYSYWGFRLDSTPLFYLQSPSDAMASVPLNMMFILPILMIMYFIINMYAVKRVVLNTFSVETPHSWSSSLVTFLAIAALIIPIRGGFSVSTMNVGRVYYSDNMLLNHAAINPMFNLLSSVSKENDFASQYRFMDEERASRIFARMTEQKCDSVKVEQLLRTDRPNIVFIILESFSGLLTEEFGIEKGVMPTIDRLYNEGIGFENIYANSFRTDRGLVALLSGYPAQPTTSIMKYPAKSQSLPSFTKSLKENGYDMSLLYGGDIDFTNMRGYFISQGIARLTADEDFPVSQRLSKWGVRDEVTFPYLAQEIREQKEQPFAKVFLTLSSHEPFDVPMRKFANPYVNSVAYTDSCLGQFIGELKQMPVWDNTLLILIADHCTRYPEDIAGSDPRRYHLPMIWAGGAIREPRRIYQYGSQTDLAATLLSQLGIDHSEFGFSKDLLNPCNDHFGFFTYNNGVGIVTDSASYVYDCDASQAVVELGPQLSFTGRDTVTLGDKAKAYLQSLYNDLAGR